MLALLEAEATLEFDYVQSATTKIADRLSQRPATPRGEVMGRFQNENNVIWSPEIYRSIRIALDRMCPMLGATQLDA
jgi:hypothetical protein